MSMDREIIVQATSDVQDAGGGQAREWVNKFRIWAEVRPSGASERLQQDQRQHVVSHRVETRYDSRITERNRLVLDDTRILEIDSLIDVNERHRFMQLECLEQTL